MTPLPIARSSKKGPKPLRRPRKRLGVRWVKRMFYRYQPGAIALLCVAVVVIPVILDLIATPMRDWINDQERHHGVAINMIENVAVALMLTAATFYFVRGRRRQRALSSYREAARDRPADLVDWWRGNRPVVPRAMSRLLAQGIARSREPAIAVVRGGAGTGRTSFVVGLVNDLAECKLIPIPVLARRDGKLELGGQARERFSRFVDPVLAADHEAGETWHRARTTRDVVIVVDGLDDELVGHLRDDDQELKNAIKALHEQRISLVLASTAELPLDGRAPLREDLDLYNREEAELHLAQEPDVEEHRQEILDGLARLCDPVDGFRIMPVYLDLLVRLRSSGISVPYLPRHRDRARARVIETYLDSVKDGDIVPGAGEDDPGAARRRGRAAIAVVEDVARTLRGGRTELAVPMSSLKSEARPLRDAVDLNLLWRGCERVGFAADDIGAYQVAATSSDCDELLHDVDAMATSEHRSARRDRHLLTALIFWHVLHPAAADAGLNGLLTRIENGGWVRPAVVGAAVRIASACQLDGYRARIRAAGDRCIDSLHPRQASVAQIRRGELPGLVRALAEWPCPDGHELLWRLATDRDAEVEWLAAKALAISQDAPWGALRPIARACTSDAQASSPAELSAHHNDLGNKVAALAWMLPALRGEAEAEQQLAAVTELCLAEEMSPLRGEMSVVQGLKLAILAQRAPEANLTSVRELLFRRRMRFWHARLILVQAVCAHGWHNPDDADELSEALAELRSRERHPFVRRAIELARDGLRDAAWHEHPLTRYLWSDERDAVRWVGQGKDELAQLAGDAVLLSNMIYRLRKIDPRRADAVAALPELPRCIRRCAQRERIEQGCDCELRLCADVGSGPAIGATRAVFTESFCREQVRLVGDFGPPPWVRRAPRARRLLERFWERQASIAREQAVARRRRAG